ncbi:MAG: hypothetical protein HOK54_14530 [Alphaproteobacteria bacterium]|nr:hypothetical protein [Alphaproteobacteria bacterium]
MAADPDAGHVDGRHQQAQQQRILAVEVVPSERGQA